MFDSTQAARKQTLVSDRLDDRGSIVRELGESIMLLALTGASVSGFLGIISLATRALGR